MSIADLITKRSQTALLMGAGAVFAGTAAAGLHGNLEYLPATLCLLFVCFMQLAGNYYYLYYEENHTKGWTAGRKMLRHGYEVRGNVSPFMLREFSFGMSLLAAMVGFSLVYMSGWWALVVGIVILILSWFSCGGEKPLLRTPAGILVTFILFGPICVITTSLLQSSHEARVMYNWFDLGPAIFMSVVVGLMCANVCLLYGYSTFLTDQRNGKTTFVTQYGRKVTRIVFFINGILFTAVSVWMCINLHLDHIWLYLIPSIVCFIINLYIWRRMTTTPRYQLAELVKFGTINVLVMGVLSYLIFEFTGVPDDSKFTFF